MMTLLLGTMAFVANTRDLNGLRQREKSCHMISRLHVHHVLSIRSTLQRVVPLIQRPYHKLIKSQLSD